MKLSSDKGCLLDMMIENNHFYRFCVALLVGVCTACSPVSYNHQSLKASQTQQAQLSVRSIALLEIEGLTFKDLNRDEALNIYEDWRLPVEERALDLLQRMTLDEKAGTLLHGSMSVFGAGNYDLDHGRKLIINNNIGSVITRLASDAELLAVENNKLQAMAETRRLGIPLTISTDPRNHFEHIDGASIAAGNFSKWPDSLGLAATRDSQLVREFADIARQEYRAVGIVQALSPMADLATEPRWPRVSGTFGEDAVLAKDLVQAYIEGFQMGGDGLQKDSVATVVKHWVAYGAAKNGFDSHSYYGRFASFPGDNFDYHITPFEGAFDANVSGVMPSYSILENLRYEGRDIEQVGAGYSDYLLQELLRERYQFDGVVLSDWGITRDCPEVCINGEYEGKIQGFGEMSTAWGVLDLSEEERYAKAMAAGIDQFGGIDEPGPLLQAIQDGMISQVTVDKSVFRILQQKFELGIFENPFVDESSALELVGSEAFNKLAQAAQRKSLVLLENKENFLPLAISNQKVYLYGVDSDLVKTFGLTPVDHPEQADFAILRVQTPYEQLHKNYVFGRRHHEGNLAFEPGNADYDAIVAASEAVPTIVTVYLDRPAVMTSIADKVSALIGNFGVSDEVLLSVITGLESPQGKLPIELPSSMEAVEAQAEDLPYDSLKPLYPFGFGLSYTANSEEAD